MTEEYISVKDRIISSAIDIISDAGLASLTPKVIGMRTNIGETMLYKYYGSINEILSDVVDYYFQFDNQIYRTIASKKCTAVEKIISYVEEYAIYYDNYYSISTLMLQYEEFLHNTATRDQVMLGIMNRKSYLAAFFEEAIKNGEITNRFTKDQLADTISGIIMIYLLNRRIEIHKGTFRTELCSNINQWLNMIKMK